MSTQDPFRGLVGGGGSAAGPTEDSVDLTKYIMAVRRRWLLLLAICLVAGGYAVLRYSLTEKIFRATTTIQIERKRLSLLALGQAGWLEDWWNLEYYPTQYRLLRSRGMAERVVLNLRLHEDPSFNSRAASVVPDDNVDTPDSSTELAALALRVQRGLSVTPIKDTQLVELSYESGSPDLAARIANGYADVFIEWGIENRTTTVGKASSFLSAQIATLRDEIEERQKQLNAYAGDSEFALDPGGEALIERRQSLESQYNRVVAERIGKEATYRELQSRPADVLDRDDAVVADLKSQIILLESEYRTKLDTYTPEWPEMVSLKDTINDKKEQLANLQSEVHRDALADAFAELQKARREEQALEDELAKIASDARTQNSAALEYINQTTYINTRKDLLAGLVKRQSETEVASRVQTSQESNVRVVDRAIVPGAPFAPSLRADLTTALLLGLIFSTGLVVLLEYLDRTVKSPEELESLLGVPTLAVIPDIDESRRGAAYRIRYGRSKYSYNYGYGYGYGTNQEKSGSDPEGNRIELLPHRSPRLAVSEAYRSLRTALLLSSADEMRMVALTSAEPGEGKTATTANLAVVMAQLGRRVLIIDADLRRPRMHKLFRISNRMGLVNYLTANVDVSAISFETEVPNLSICPSGPIPPNPSELLASDRMKQLLEGLRRTFDFILIDTPPILPVADAIILGAMADGVIVCARTGALVREDAKFCRERLAYSELKTIGAVLNRYSAGKGGYQRKYRYYGVYEEPRQGARNSAA